jgi:hypothetical protein
MKFVVGQTWKTRAGKDVVIESVMYPGKQYPIFGRFKDMPARSREAGRTFTAEGEYIGGGPANDNDLVALVNFDVNEIVKALPPIVATPRSLQRVVTLKSIIAAGRAAKPQHEGGAGENMVYLTPEMYNALERIQRERDEAVGTLERIRQTLSARAKEEA